MVFQRAHFHPPRVREVNTLIYTLSMITFAENLISIFVPIFLFTIGYSIAQVIGFYLLGAVYFVILGFLLKDLLRKANDKLLLTIGLPFITVFYILLPQITVYPVLYFILPAFTAVFGLFFNVGYHSDFSTSCEDGHSGADVGRQFAFGSLTAVASPFIGGYLISIAGFGSTFYIASILLLSAVLPLWLYPRHTIKKDRKKIKPFRYIKDTNLRPINISSFGYAIEASVGSIIWPLFLYSVISKTVNIGLLASSALLVAALVSLFLGKIIDKRKSDNILSLGNYLISANWLVRAFVSAISIISVSQVLGGFFTAVARIPWSKKYYAVIHKMKDPGGFILTIEIIFNLSRVIVLPLFIILAMFVQGELFYRVVFIITALIFLLYSWINKQDGQIPDGSSYEAP